MQRFFHRLGTPTAGFAILCAALGLVSASPAWACGGCFSPPSPQLDQTVLQSGERVLFVRDAATQVSHVWVEVRYTGLAKDFGWVLPLPKVPKVGVGTRLLFDALDARMGLRYGLVHKPDENCRSSWDGCENNEQYPTAGGADAGLSFGADGGASNDGAHVDILASGTTGPYDYTVVKGSDAEVLYTWLNTRGYATPDKAKPILQSHIDKGDVFVAVKLSNGQGVEAIRPITLDMDNSEACVPLRLTSIAAQDDLLVTVTLAGAGRAVVKNHLDVEANPLHMALTTDASSIDCTPEVATAHPEDYTTCSVPKNLGQVLSQAIDEAGGHAFVTESALAGSQLGAIKSLSADSIAWLKNVNNLDALASQLAGNALPINDEIGDTVNLPLALTQTFPKISAAQALANLRACGQYWQMPASPSCTLPDGTSLTHEQLQAVAVDGSGAAKAITVGIIDPLFLVADLVLGSAKVTRLSMRVSPVEMDRDPIFSYNPGLADVQPTRLLQTNTVCTEGWSAGVIGTRLSIDGFGSWVFVGNNAVDVRFAKVPFALWMHVQEESGAPLEIAPTDVPVVDAAIKGAVVGKPSLGKDLVLKTPVPWQPPMSDSLVKTVGPWHLPQPWCTPKAGWVDGHMAPAAAQADATAGDSSAADAGSTVPGIDAASGWTGDSSPASVAATPRNNSGCSSCAAASGMGLGWLLAGCLLLLGRRRIWG